MNFFRHWRLIACVLVLGGGQLAMAASREDRAYAAAVAAFNTKIWDRAETELAQFRQRFPKSERLTEAVLLQAQADYQQGKFAEVIALLADAGKAGKFADQYVYWTAQARFRTGDLVNAAEIFAALAGKFPQSPLGLTATVEAAAAWERLGNWPKMVAVLGDDNGGLQRAVRLKTGGETVARGLLLLARARAAQKDFTGADAVLARLDVPALTGELNWQRNWLRYQNKAAENDWAAALAAAEDLLLLAPQTQSAENLAAAQAMRATALEKLNRPAEAELAWSQNLANVPAEYQSNAVLQVAALAVAQNNFTNAEAALEKFTAQFPASPVAALAWLTLGELNLKNFIASPADTNQLALAQTRFDQATNSPLAGRAFLDRGWLGWLAGRTNDCFADFAQAEQRLPFSADLAVAKFKAGDAQFLLGDFAGAKNHYQSVLADFAALPAVAQSLGAPALYQLLRADLELKDTNGVAAAMAKLLAQFPASELVDNSLLLAGEGFSNFSSPVKAREIFQRFAQVCPDSPLKPDVAFALARTFEREQQWPAALAGYADWLKQFPTNGLRPQVEFALGQANFRAGNESNAYALLADFPSRFPTNALAPLALWWVADSLFRAGNFGGAETNYENIFQNADWRGSPLYYRAQLMAGRAAMARQGFSDANRYFTALISDTNCPLELAELKIQARFAFAASLMQTPADTNNPGANLQLATNILSQLPATNQVGVKALSQMADCALQLGDFDGATNLYAQVAGAANASVGLRSRALVGLGLTLEKKAALLPAAARQPLLALALKNYLDVLDVPLDLPDGEQADAFWVKKAGLQALPLMIALKDGDVDALITRLEGLFPQLIDPLEKKRAALK